MSDHPPNLSPALRRLAALLTVLLLATGCTFLGQSSGTPQPPTATHGQSTGTPGPSPSPTPAPETAWEKALDKIGPDGTFDLQSSLDLFATAFGPLPGSSAQQDLTGINDRTVAIDAVMNHADELTAEQRTAIDNYIKPPPDATKITVPPPAQGDHVILAAAAPAVDDAQQAAIRQLVAAQRQYIADHMHDDFDGEIEFYFSANPPGDPTLLGQAWSDWPGGNFGTCQIYLYAHTFELSDKVMSTVIAHELFHCFQFNGYGTLKGQAAAARWIIEGQADWVGEVVGGPSGKDNHWRPYLKIPYKSLFERIYDAIGFYSHLAERGTNPWDIFADMWAEGTNNIAAYAATGATDDEFLDTWASGELRQPSRGSAWDTTGPNIPATMAYGPNFFDVSDGSKVDLSTPFYTNEVRYLICRH